MQEMSRTRRSGFRPRHVPRTAFAGTFVVALAGAASGQWPQWGGPNRDFQSPATDLAEEWPEAGPRKLWERALGAGYSSIVADGERLFTLYRSGEEEVVVSLDAETGATVWEWPRPVPFLCECVSAEVFRYIDNAKWKAAIESDHGRAALDRLPSDDKAAAIEGDPGHWLHS